MGIYGISAGIYVCRGEVKTWVREVSIYGEPLLRKGFPYINL